MTEPLLSATADCTWDTAITLEEPAESIWCATGAFAQAVRSFAGSAQSTERYTRLAAQTRRGDERCDALTR